MIVKGFLVGSEMTEDTTLIALYEVAHENMELKMVDTDSWKLSRTSQICQRLKKISNELGHLQVDVSDCNRREYPLGTASHMASLRPWCSKKTWRRS